MGEWGCGMGGVGGITNNGMGWMAMDACFNISFARWATSIPGKIETDVDV